MSGQKLSQAIGSARFDRIVRLPAIWCSLMHFTAGILCVTWFCFISAVITWRFSNIFWTITGFIASVAISFIGYYALTMLHSAETRLNSYETEQRLRSYISPENNKYLDENPY